MGLDLYFNKQKAIAAGLRLVTETNGTAEEIARAKQQTDADADYLDWLKEECQVIDVPNSEYRVVAIDCGDDLVVRANKWGNVYAPLTTWLKSKDISWDEN